MRSCVVALTETWLMAMPQISAILPQDKVPKHGRREVPGIIAPGFLDLQVNGGGGVMVDGATDLAALRRTGVSG